MNSIVDNVTVNETSLKQLLLWKKTGMTKFKWKTKTKRTEKKKTQLFNNYNMNAMSEGIN